MKTHHSAPLQPLPLQHPCRFFITMSPKRPRTKNYNCKCLTARKGNLPGAGRALLEPTATWAPCLPRGPCAGWTGVDGSVFRNVASQRLNTAMIKSSIILI